ncbi:MAG: tyrosine-type recombinase/integrase [Humibacillus sp.]|uniref:Tyrosine-type recombinase/integrase n=1 Tax=Branchiibius cervicis TaxID=908252 RepID=A0ABW2AUI7_9MICO|nr:tyrosine-type recombinase/integrase [Humibacillus sp.]
MAWKVERAVLQDGWKTRLIVDDRGFDLHPEAMGFVVAMEAAERSPNTVKTYLAALAGFLNWADVQGVDWRTVNVLDLTRYKRHLQEEPSRTGRPRSTATVGLSLTAVAEFLRYCASDGHIDPVVANRLVENRWVHPKGRRGAGESGQFRRARINALRVNLIEQPPEVLSEEQVAAMRSRAASARDRFLLRVLHDGGPRIGETLGLRTEDVHLLPNSRSLGCAVAGAHLHVNRRTDNQNGALAKSRRPRHLPVADVFVADYRDYQHERFMRFGDRQSGYMFVNYEGSAVGQPMTYSNVYKLVTRLGRSCGFRATPHMFRHSAATAWVEAGSDVDVVQALLGHASPASTAIYLHASDERMREAVTRVHAARGRRA